MPQSILLYPHAPSEEGAFLGNSLHTRNIFICKNIKKGQLKINVMIIKLCWIKPHWQLLHCFNDYKWKCLPIKPLHVCNTRLFSLFAWSEIKWSSRPKYQMWEEQHEKYNLTWFLYLKSDRWFRRRSNSERTKRHWTEEFISINNEREICTNCK